MNITFKQFLIEQSFFPSGNVGIAVSQPGDPEYMDFSVFVWPDPDNTISDQGRYLESKLDPNNPAQYDAFYNMLNQQFEKRIKAGQEVFGPFNSITDLIK